MGTSAEIEYGELGLFSKFTKAEDKILEEAQSLISDLKEKYPLESFYLFTNIYKEKSPNKKIGSIIIFRPIPFLQNYL